MISDDNRSLKSKDLENLLHDQFYAAEKLDLICDPLEWSVITKEPFNAERQAKILATFLEQIYGP